MKRAILATTALLATTAAASAGSLDAPVVEQPVIAPLYVAPTTYDWSGFYAGAFGGLGFGSTDLTPGGSDTLTSDTTYGGFAGYNFQSGPWVYGAELSGGWYDPTPQTATGDSYDYVIDGKLRAGYAVDNVLLYGFGGLSTASYTTAANDSYQLWGPNFGAGLALGVTDHVQVGAEYTGRYLMGDTATAGVSQSDWANSVAARVSFSF